MSSPELANEASYLELSARLEHEFTDLSVLQLALTHRSYCAEAEAAESNERLEFLGDAILGLAVTDQLYTRFPGRSEGELAKVRAAVVSSTSLADVARDLNLGPHLRLGRGEDSSGGRAKGSILADATEAVIGAVYLDGGWEAARALVGRLLGDEVVDVTAAGPGASDYKTRLQELVAHLGFTPPEYRVGESGPDHDKRFQATVRVGELDRGEGFGTSKKQAEQSAAQQAWTALAGDAALSASTAVNDAVTEPSTSTNNPTREQADV